MFGDLALSIREFVFQTEYLQTHTSWQLFPQPSIYLGHEVSSKFKMKANDRETKLELSTVSPGFTFGGSNCRQDIIFWESQGNDR